MSVMTGNEASTETYSKLQKLFSVLDKGDEFLGLKGFKTNAYENCDRAVFNKIEIEDHVINELILDLACDADKGGKKLFVDYKRISAEHLGGIFESLLEFKPHLTAKKSVVLESATGRKDSGSYYTPDYVVDYLLERSLRSTDDFSKIKVLDSAWIGTFHCGCHPRISTRLAEVDSESDGNLEILRNEVASKNVFGIDRSEVAVALTKLSIYLTVMQRDQALPNVDDNIKCTDSLRDKSIKGFKGSFDLVVGNPPYVNTKNLSRSDQELKTYLADSGDYLTCKGCFDLYIPFIEKALTYFFKIWRSAFACALPNKLMVADHAEQSRLLAEKLSEEIRVIDVSPWMF
ncbi:MAG: N-6 DNA methylase [Bdellovibrionales bacterium]|nr:N-6 DNA methylase [Bdellovibrionales bacterium]